MARTQSAAKKDFFKDVHDDVGISIAVTTMSCTIMSIVIYVIVLKLICMVPLYCIGVGNPGTLLYTGADADTLSPDLSISLGTPHPSATSWRLLPRGVRKQCDIA